MAIIAGQDGLASDFVDTSAGAADEGKVPKLNADGVLDKSFVDMPVPVTRVYTSTDTWSKPAGLKYVRIKGVAMGGAGASNNGGGGGAGEYGEMTIAEAGLGSTETVTIGTAAAATTFGSHMVLKAGGNASGVQGGSTGSGGSGGDFRIDGGYGDYGGNGDTSGSGRGGTSMLGPGGPRVLSQSSSAAVNGITPGGYGGGGSGGANANDGSPTGSGAVGAPAVMIVTEHYV